MATTAKPAFDYAAHQKALAQFTEKLEEHLWSFMAVSYHDLTTAQAAEVELFKEAQHLGIQGVDEFVYHRGLVLDTMTTAAYHRGYDAQKKLSDDYVEHLRKQLEETRQKYMKPIDFFKEKLEKHDWYYDFSDDIAVYRRGKAAEKKKKKEAKELGSEFEAAFNEAHQRVVNNIQNK